MSVSSRQCGNSDPPRSVRSCVRRPDADPATQFGSHSSRSISQAALDAPQMLAATLLAPGGLPHPAETIGISARASKPSAGRAPLWGDLGRGEANPSVLT
jgi:hypothetical protein